MSAPAVLEPLGVVDAGELLTLQRAAYVSEARLHDDLELPPLVQSLDELVDEITDPSVTAWGIRDSARLVAAMRIRVQDNTAEIGRLIVAPDLQGRGLGTRLLSGVDALVPSEIERFELFTGEKSVANIRLYERLGFREFRRLDIGPYQLVFLERRRSPDDGDTGCAE